MIYFDNAATSFPKAPGVAAAMSKFISEDAANPGRSGHRMAKKAEDMLDDVRLRLTRLFGGIDEHRMVFAMNGTDALNMAIKGVVPTGSMKSGNLPHVITTVLEHNSVSRPLAAMEEHGRITLTRVDINDEGFIDPDDVRKAITPDTVLIVITHGSNVLGTIQDAGAVGCIAREANILFCLDAAQTAGASPVDIEKMCIDLLAFPGHKSLLGPTGTGGLYVGERCPHPAESVAVGDDGKRTNRMASYMKLQPWREGGTGGDSSSPTQPTIYPYYLEGGTPNTVGVAGLAAGIDYLDKHPMADLLAHEQHMVQRILDTLGDDTRFTLYGTREASKRVGTVSFNTSGWDSRDLSAALDSSFEIAVRSGLHCAPYCHKRIGTFPEGAVRISPGVFNTEAELDTLLDALKQIAGG
ncbi:MAG: aminotransferase class V-fold PLP-dependent enzyme [Phycisphaeraceae bacterium]